MVPLKDNNGRLADTYMTCCCNAAKNYFPTRVITEDEAAFSTEKTYVVGECRSGTQYMPPIKGSASEHYGMFMHTLFTNHSSHTP